MRKFIFYDYQSNRQIPELKSDTKSKRNRDIHFKHLSESEELSKFVEEERDQRKITEMSYFNHLKKPVMATLLLMASLTAYAQAVSPDMTGAGAGRRPVRSEMWAEGGWMSAQDTYLSPLRYEGPTFSLNGNWSKDMPFDSRWRMEFLGKAGMGFMQNPAKNANMVDLDLLFAWGMKRKIDLAQDIVLAPGATASANGGLLYLNRNSNNPVSARCNISIDLTLSGKWTFRMGKIKSSLIERFRLPSLSMFFSPGYGETYYEIWLGNRSGLLHIGWWGNHLCADNLLMLDMNFGKRGLLLGWRTDYSSAWANNLNRRIWRNSLVVGISF